MKNFFKTLSVLVLMLSLCQVSRAQYAVFDAEGLANDIYQGGMQAEQWLRENTNAIESLHNIEVMNSWIDQHFGEGSTWQKIMGKVKESRDMVSLLGSVNRATKDYIDYTKYISTHFEDLDPSVTARMIRMTSDLLKKTESCYEAAYELIADDQMSYDQKRIFLRRSAKEAESAADEMEETVESMINGTSAAKGATVALGILDGMDQAGIEDLLKGVGGNSIWAKAYGGTDRSAVDETLKDPEPVEKGDVTTREVLGQDSHVFGDGMRTAFKILSVLLGLLMVGMLVIVYIKWNRGEYGAGDYGERGFMSIYIAIAVGSFILSILAAYAGFGL